MIPTVYVKRSGISLTDDGLLAVGEIFEKDAKQHTKETKSAIIVCFTNIFQQAMGSAFGKKVK